MYLSKLEIFGFKSFAQKTNLKFKEGISCVIGPNGSGKSNIVDALRWVLGEQKVNTLRSDRMENVIFNGTKKRKPLGLAEVSLTIQNNKKILDTEFTDVVISRRLYRSGESQYLINKTPCRLKDILNLFMDTGLGPNSYSVIELKMVESIISENASERRHLFEEAAGVTKYKIRRKSAMRKLDATHQDMERISDLISEIQRTVNSLSRQVGKARRYLKYQEELKNKEIDLARFRYMRLLDEIRPMELQLAEIKSLKEDTTHQITLEEALMEEYRSELVKIEQSLSKKNEEIFEQDQLIQKLQEEDAVARTRNESIDSIQIKSRQEISEAHEKIKHLENSLLEYGSEVERLDSETTALQQTYSEKEAEFGEANNQNILEKKRVDELNAQFKTELETLSSRKEGAQKDLYEYNWNREQKIKISSQINEMDKLITVQKKKLDDAEDSLKINQQKLSACTGRLSKLIDKKSDIESGLEEHKENLRKSESAIENINSKIKFFEQIISRYEGHSDSIREVMANKTKFPGLLGPIADLLSVDTKYRVALEAALGTAAGFLVVENVETAKKIIEFVSTKDLGRITLLPLDRVETLDIPDQMENGAHSLLLSFVNFDTRFQKMFTLLLADFVVVNSLEEAINASNKSPQLRYVSLAGELVEPGRTISGGKKSEDNASLIGRKEQLEQLHQQAKSLQKTVKSETGTIGELEASLQRTYSEINNLKEQESGLQQQVRNDELLCSQSEIELENLKQKKKELQEQFNTAVRRISELEKSVSTLEQDISGQQEKLNQLEKETIARTS